MATALERTDPDIFAAIGRETERQRDNLELIASENIVSEGVRESGGRIDLGPVRERARRERPKMLVVGHSAYPRAIDFAPFRAIADEVGATVMADMAHFAGLVAAGIHPSPVPHCEFVTTT